MRDNASTDPHLISKVTHFSPEIRDVLTGVKGTAHLLDAIRFFEHFVFRVYSIFQNCKEADQAIPKPGTYNPAKYGRAYYFTPHGNQLRDIPRLSPLIMMMNLPDLTTSAKRDLKLEEKVLHSYFFGLIRNIMAIAMDII